MPPKSAANRSGVQQEVQVQMMKYTELKRCKFHKTLNKVPDCKIQ